MKYSLVGLGDVQALTVYADGDVHVARSDTHSNWKDILAKTLAGDESVVNDFSPAEAISRRYEKVTDRLSISNGAAYFDGDPLPDALSRHVVRSLETPEGKEHRVIKFLEKVMQNPDQHSREQSYEWFLRKDFGIDKDGNVVGYKAVNSVDGKPGVYRPSRVGPGIVNGVEVPANSYIEQKVGDVVEMPRSKVTHDPAVGCSVGLHVSNYSYASTFSGDTLLRVSVNPCHIVSVPTECDWDKMRVSRYVVEEATPKTSYNYDSSEFYYGDDEDEEDLYDEEYEDDEWDEDEYEDEETQDFDARENDPYGYAGSHYNPGQSVSADTSAVDYGAQAVLNKGDYRHNFRNDKGQFTKRL